MIVVVFVIVVVLAAGVGIWLSIPPKAEPDYRTVTVFFKGNAAPLTGEVDWRAFKQAVAHGGVELLTYDHEDGHPAFGTKQMLMVSGSAVAFVEVENPRDA